MLCNLWWPELQVRKAEEVEEEGEEAGGGRGPPTWAGCGTGPVSGPHPHGVFFGAAVQWDPRGVCVLWDPPSVVRGVWDPPMWGSVVLWDPPMWG